MKYHNYKIIYSLDFNHLQYKVRIIAAAGNEGRRSKLRTSSRQEEQKCEYRLRHLLPKLIVGLPLQGFHRIDRDIQFLGDGLYFFAFEGFQHNLTTLVGKCVDGQVYPAEILFLNQETLIDVGLKRDRYGKLLHPGGDKLLAVAQAVHAGVVDGTVEIGGDGTDVLENSVVLPKADEDLLHDVLLPAIRLVQQAGGVTAQRSIVCVVQAFILHLVLVVYRLQYLTVAVCHLPYL